MNAKENIVRPWEEDKTVYLWHPPKTGGTSIWFNLKRVSRLNGHAYWYRIPDHRVIITESRDFHKWMLSEPTWCKHLSVLKTTIPAYVPSILAVRDPYSRCMSMYSYFQKHQAKKSGRSLGGFSEWFKQYVDYKKRWFPWRPCAVWKNHLTGPVAILRYEYLREDFREITGHEWSDEYDFNATKKWTREDALCVYSQRDVDNINRVFAEDFEVFGYEKV